MSAQSRDSLQAISYFLANYDKIKESLTSDRYPCPICARTRNPQMGQLRVWLDGECDDMGYKVSSWPVFEGECADPPPDALSVHILKRVRPRNHADQLNATMDDDHYGESEEIARLMGQMFERQRIKALLGL